MWYVMQHIKKGTLQVKPVLSFLIDVLELFVSFKMAPHLSNFTIEKVLNILIDFFIIFRIFSSISEEVHSGRVPFLMCYFTYMIEV